MLGRIPRKLFRENLNVLLIPESGAEIVSFRLRRGVLRGVACGAAVAGLFLVVSGQVFMEWSNRGRELGALASENHALRTELAGIHETIDVLQAAVTQNADYEARARALAGLDDLSTTEEFGLGGSGIVGRPDDPFADPALRRLVVEAEVELDDLVRDTQSSQRVYEEVLDVLRERQQSLDHMPSIHPLAGQGWYSSGYGYRDDPFTGRRAFHAGLDISAHVGSEVVATAAGVVKSARRDRFFGYAVRIDHGNGVETVYAHNSENLVKKGDRVTRGQVVAKVGSTGRSTGPHLHYAVIVDGKHTNPLAYILPDDVIVD